MNTSSTVVKYVIIFGLALIVFAIVLPFLLKNNDPTDSITAELDILSIRYNGVSFDPAEVTLQYVDSEADCLINLINNSSEEMLPRLGPYQESDNRGSAYFSIPPGGQSGINPVYRGVPDPVFYDRNNLGAELIVHLDESCQLQ